ncbi:MAG: hypothetical protein JWO02_401 [Solirubrobacterales bacterium]|nr:hypothetical protein [Solirubrobacterales bacterium]
MLPVRYNLCMSNLTRRDRESRAFALTMTTGGLGLASVVTFALLIFGVGSFGIFLLLLIGTIVSLMALRTTMKR